MFSSGGGFRHLDYYSLFSIMINSAVLLTVPMLIVRFIALYGIGALSTIYKRFMQQKLQIFQQFHCVGIHMMLCQMTFRALTNQWDKPWEDLQAIQMEDLNRYMTEAFHRE